MLNALVLSLFPGIDVLGRGFAAAGFSVVKGPDLLWDEHIEDFHTVHNYLPVSLDTYPNG